MGRISSGVLPRAVVRGEVRIMRMHKQADGVRWMKVLSNPEREIEKEGATRPLKKTKPQAVQKMSDARRKKNSRSTHIPNMRVFEFFAATKQMAFFQQPDMLLRSLVLVLVLCLAGAHAARAEDSDKEGADPIEYEETMPNDIFNRALPLVPENEVPCRRGEPIPMTLEECVALAMRQNVNIRIAYLGRVLQKFDLVTSTYYTFAPNLNINGELKRSRTDSVTNTHIDYNTDGTASYTQDHTRTLTDTIAGQPEITGLAPTGARYAMSWRVEDTREFSESKTTTGGLTRSSTDFVPTRRRSLERTLRFSLTQPLLKGAGFDYNLAPVKQALIDEKVNVLNLKNSIITELTNAIQTYRQLLSAKWNVAISANSLQRARENLEMAKVKIDLGKMARLDVVQYEADEANRMLSLEQARNGYNTARLNLLQVLDMNRGMCIEPVEEIAFEPVELDTQKLSALVVESQPDYLIAMLGIKSGELTLLQAQRDRLWDLTFTADGALADPTSHTDARGQDTNVAGHSVDWAVGLNLNFPLFGEDERTLRRRVLHAKTALHTARIQLKKLQDDILNELDQRVSDITLLQRQVELSHRSRVLADKKLWVERIKLEKGRSSTFQLVTFQDQQFQAQQDELNARIAYLDALANLDSYLGVTMESWNIAFRSYREEMEEEINDVSIEFQWGLDAFTSLKNVDAGAP